MSAIMLLNLVLLILIEWSNNVRGNPQAFQNFGFGPGIATTYQMTPAGSFLPPDPGNPLLELETFLYNFLRMDQNECLLYVFCKQAINDTLPTYQQSMAPALRALRFILNNLQSISEVTGFDEKQNLPGLKAFAAAGFMGAASKNATLCHEKYPACPTNPDQLSMYLQRFTSMKEIRQFAGSITKASVKQQLVTSAKPTGLDYADHGNDLSALSLYGMDFRRHNWRKRRPPPDISFIHSKLDYFTEKKIPIHNFRLIKKRG